MNGTPELPLMESGFADAYRTAANHARHLAHELVGPSAAHAQTRCYVVRGEVPACPNVGRALRSSALRTRRAVLSEQRILCGDHDCARSVVGP